MRTADQSSANKRRRRKSQTQTRKPQTRKCKQRLKRANKSQRRTWRKPTQMIKAQIPQRRKYLEGANLYGANLEGANEAQTSKAQTSRRKPRRKRKVPSRANSQRAYDRLQENERGRSDYRLLPAGANVLHQRKKVPGRTRRASSTWADRTKYCTLDKPEAHAGSKSRTFNLSECAGSEHARKEKYNADYPDGGT